MMDYYQCVHAWTRRGRRCMCAYATVQFIGLLCSVLYYTLADHNQASEMHIEPDSRRVTLMRDTMLSSSTRRVQLFSAVTPQLPNDELQALKDLFYNCSGDQWTWDNQLPVRTRWNFSIPNINPCRDYWQGIQCSCQNITVAHSQPTVFYYFYYGNESSNVANLCYIEKIFLAGRNLKGKLPRSLGNLQNLTHLHLGMNQISGSLPSEIFKQSASGRTKSLQVISIPNSRLSHTIPTAVGLASNLKFIDFGQSELTGSLPAELGNLKLLNYFYFDSNGFVGSIPLQLFQLRNLKGIHGPHNKLIGKLPSQMSSLSNLRFFEMHFNSLSGTIPSSISAISKLRKLTLNNNMFSSTLPTTFFTLTTLVDLFIGFNHFSGTLLPFSGLRSLRTLSFAGCNFNGSIPSQLGLSLTNLTLFYATSNQLTSSLPMQLSHLTKMVQFDVKHNLLVGTIPDWIGLWSSLQLLRMSYNSFDGTLPYSLFQLKNIQSIILGVNSLRGTISNEVSNGALASLSILDIHSNRLSGSLPDRLFQIATNLTVFASSSNCFKVRQLPETICQASKLTGLFVDGLHASQSCRILLYPLLSDSIYLQYNDDLSGNIPSCIYSMPKLQSLHASGNGYFGPIFTSPNVILGPALQDLSISHNSFTGTIPAAIQQRKWYQLDLSFNRLAGTLSPEMSIQQNGSVRLLVNRLSDALPLSFQTAANISILDGNIFTCVTESRIPLPRNDPEYIAYNCGSNDLEIAIYSWIGVVIFCAIIFGIAILLLRSSDKSSSRLPSLCSPFLNNLRESMNEVQSWLAVFQPYTLSQGLLITMPRQTIAEVVLNPLGIRGYVNATATAASARSTSSSGSNQTIQPPLLHEVMDDDTQSLTFRSVILFGICMSQLRIAALLTTVLVMTVMLCSYIGLSAFFSTHANTYAWYFSVGYIHSQTGAIFLTILFCAFFMALRIIFSATVFRIHWTMKDTLRAFVGRDDAVMPPSQSNTPSSINRKTSIQLLRPSIIWKVYVKPYRYLALVMVINCVIVAGVNAAFVYLYLTVPVAYNFPIILALSFYKLGWGRSVVPWMIKVADLLAPNYNYNNEINDITTPENYKVATSQLIRNTSLQVLLSIINNIIIPCAATMALSPLCFRYAIFSSPIVSGSYSFRQCENFEIENGRTICLRYAESYQFISIQPPLNYTYQCASSVISNYSSVFVYVLATSALFTPFRCLLVYALLTSTPENSFIKPYLTSLLPTSLRPFSSMDPIADSQEETTSSNIVTDTRRTLVAVNSKALAAERVKSPDSATRQDVDSVQDESDNDINAVASTTPKYGAKAVVNIELFVSEILTSVFIMVTFGVAFPFLSILALTTIVSQTYFTQIFVGRLVVLATRHNSKHILRRVNSDCNGIAAVLNHTVRYSFGLGLLFLALFVYDVGETENEFWGPVVLILFSMVLYCLKYAVRRETNRGFQLIRQWAEWIVGSCRRPQITTPKEQPPIFGVPSTSEPTKTHFNLELFDDNL